MQLFLKSW